MRSALAALAAFTGNLLALAMPILAMAILAMPIPALAQGSLAGRTPYLELQQRDQKLFAAGWRLVTGNAALCDRTVIAAGALFHDAMTYPDPADARTSLGLHGDVAVQVVAADSPAERGGLNAGATLAGLNGLPIDAMFPPTEPRWQRLTDIAAALDTIMARDGSADLTLLESDGRAVTRRIVGVRACATRFEVAGIGSRAVADGERVVFGDRFPGFAWPEEEFAAAVAHELAHNVLRHRQWLALNGRSRSNVRLTEQEADRLTPWLMANAGYDPAAAVRFMRRWGPQHDGGLFRRRTHAGWDERADVIAAELPLVSRLRAQGGLADWPRLFVRDTGD